MSECLYVTRGWGVHDERWVSALRSQGFEPVVLSVAEDFANLEEIQAEIRMHPDQPVLAGPLIPIAEAIVGSSQRVIGLSWGFDLHHATDLDWLPQLAGLIVDSSATKQIAVDAGIPDGCISTLPWGVDLTTFTNEGSSIDPTVWNLPSQTRILLSLRAHETLYRISEIIEAFAEVANRHPDVALMIGHDGSLTPELEQQVHHLGLDHRVRFIGRMAEAELPAIMRSATAYITASEVDGTSVTLLQAMACGTPVIASDNPGNRDWVTQETGVTFPVGSIDALAAAIEQVLDDPEQATGRAHAAREAVTQHADWRANRVLLGHAMRQAAY
jgi:L-malate glycosyltransferase